MRKQLLLLFFISCWVSLKAQYAGYNPLQDITTFKAAFTTSSQKIQSIKSDFIQEKNLSMLSEKIVSKGKFWFKKSNLVRMEYTQPFSYLVIINNNNFFVKDGQKENKISTSSNKLFQQINRIMVDCVQGTALSNADFSIKVFDNSRSFLVELTPVAKGLAAYFKNIALVIERKDYSIMKIEMHELSGDYTTISFINKELNINLPDALFAIN